MSFFPTDKDKLENKDLILIISLSFISSNGYLFSIRGRVFVSNENKSLIFFIICFSVNIPSLITSNNYTNYNNTNIKEITDNIDKMLEMINRRKKDIEQERKYLEELKEQYE